MGKVLLIDFGGQDEGIFEEIYAILRRSSNFKWLSIMENKPSLLLSCLEMNLERRKVFFDNQEIRLTIKKFDLLHLMTAHEGRVFTYMQLYRNIWNQDPLENERNIIGCYIRSLRRKPCAVDKEGYIRIRCIREIGYCLEQIK